VYFANALKETVVKINTNDGSFHKDFGIKTSKGGPGSKSHWDISLKKIQKAVKRPTKGFFLYILYGKL
jgi:hypothetical protein